VSGGAGPGAAAVGPGAGGVASCAFTTAPKT